MQEGRFRCAHGPLRHLRRLCLALWDIDRCCSMRRLWPGLFSAVARWQAWRCTGDRRFKEVSCQETKDHRREKVGKGQAWLGKVRPPVPMGRGRPRVRVVQEGGETSLPEKACYFGLGNKRNANGRPRRVAGSAKRGDYVCRLSGQCTRCRRGETTRSAKGPPTAQGQSARPQKREHREERLARAGEKVGGCGHERRLDRPEDRGGQAPWLWPERP